MACARPRYADAGGYCTCSLPVALRTSRRGQVVGGLRDLPAGLPLGHQGRLRGLGPVSRRRCGSTRPAPGARDYRNAPVQRLRRFRAAHPDVVIADGGVRHLAGPYPRGERRDGHHRARLRKLSTSWTADRATGAGARGLGCRRCRSWRRSGTDSPTSAATAWLARRSSALAVAGRSWGSRWRCGRAIPAARRRGR